VPALGNDPIGKIPVRANADRGPSPGFGRDADKLRQNCRIGFGTECFIALAQAVFEPIRTRRWPTRSSEVGCDEGGSALASVGRLA
jgi:hypothetical protein